jgi:UDP-N-acetylmuramoyl-tripeptide--D-alanyl-D-alanine ligase
MDFKTLANCVEGKLNEPRFERLLFTGVSIDSRAILPNQLFIAIKGENTDGHRYIDAAVAKGAAGVIVSENYGELKLQASRLPIVAVSDTHQAMMRLAAKYRQNLKAKLIAITGSNGKTTTKEITYAIILSKIGSVYRSPGNLNNLFGLPLSLFAVPKDAAYGVFELGISTMGEMTRLAGILRPDLGLITNVGPTHLETLGTVDNVAEAKMELIDSLPIDAPAIINADIPELAKAAGKRKRKFFSFGLESDADFTARRAGISPEGFPIVAIDGVSVKIPLFGAHQAYNILAGYAIARILGIDLRPEELNEINYDFAPYRGEIENIDGAIAIADCYNANPDSMKSGLESFAEYVRHPLLERRRSIVVVGDMLELGEGSIDFHKNIGRLIARLDFSLALTVGPLSADVYSEAIRSGLPEEKIRNFHTVEAAGEFLLKTIDRGDILYFKASRGIALEKIITLLKGSAFRQN